MLDKPSSPRGSAGAGKKGSVRQGRPDAGLRARSARPAGNPVKGPAGSGKLSGVDRKTLTRLQEEGMLSAEGRALLGGVDGKSGPKKGPRLSAGARAKGAPLAAGVRVRKAGGPGRALSPAEDEVAQRLHKVMAQAGLASRRHSEELIQAGRVKVNGKVVTELGSKVVPGKDIIEVDDRPLSRPEELVYLLLNKPKGYVTTLFDPQGRPKVVDLLGGEIGQRVYPVGRLDFDTEGLLLLTNDGELANAIMHPARQVKKTYIAKLRGVPGPAKLRALETGVELEDGVTAPAEVRMVDVKPPNAATVSIRIHEGRNRQVRRMFEAVGHEVIHLRRTTLGPLQLKDLELGAWRHLTPDEVTELRRATGLKAAGPAATGRARTAAAGRPAPGGRGRAAFVRSDAGAGPKGRPARVAGPRPDFGWDGDEEAPAASPKGRAGFGAGPKGRPGFARAGSAPGPKGRFSPAGGPKGRPTLSDGPKGRPTLSDGPKGRQALSDGPTPVSGPVRSRSVGTPVFRKNRTSK